MRTKNPIFIVLLLLGSLIVSANAQNAADPPSESVALEIIATQERIKSSFYKIIRITPGHKQDKDGFVEYNVVRVTAFAPGSAGRPNRTIKHYLLHYTDEYGWYIESVKRDARGVYLEISSQKKGRVFVR